MKNTDFYTKSLLPFIVVGLSATFYLYEFCLRVIPSVLGYNIMHDMAINATLFSVISTSFYYGYIPMQIPIGMLCDRYGPKKLLVLSAALCSLSTLIFAYSSSIFVSSMSRCIIGMASASAFIAPLTLTNRWYDRKYFALITGIIQFLGCLGAVIGGTPIALLSAQLGWRPAIIWTGLIGIVLCILYFFFIQDNPKGSIQETPKHTNWHSEIVRLKGVIRKRQNWYTALAGMSCWAGIAIFAELWGIPFLMDLQHISNAAAANETAFIWYGLAIASPIAGWWSDKIASRTKPLIVFAAIGFVSSSLLIYGNITNILTVDCLLFFFGASAAAQSITFGIISDNNEQDVISTAIGFNNMAVISGAVLQTVVGLVINAFWQGHLDNGVPIYTVTEFKYGFILIPCISLMLMFTGKFLIKETHCKKTTIHA